MPYISTWVPPKKLLMHKGVSVYCTYKNDDIENNEPRDDWFITDPSEGEDGTTGFDVTQLPTWSEPPEPPCLSDVNPSSRDSTSKLWDQWFIDRKAVVKQAIRQAINRKLLTQTGVVVIPKD